MSGGWRAGRSKVTLEDPQIIEALEAALRAG
jgi:hypothetical protein